MEKHPRGSFEYLIRQQLHRIGIYDNDIINAYLHALEIAPTDPEELDAYMDQLSFGLIQSMHSGPKRKPIDHEESEDWEPY